jgi:serine/threonine-protein kinase ULK4
VEVLASGLASERDVKSRRRLMATLGELLFYVASQQQDAAPGSGSAWHVPSVTISQVCRLLKAGEDEVAQVQT